MNLIDRLHHLDPGNFNRRCSIIGLCFLILVMGAKSAVYERRHIPPMEDFPQYYMGGLVALHGAWDSMYPIPIPGSHTNPGFVGNSTLRPGYRALAQSHGITEESVRYMQPPPLALLLAPLAALPAKASFYVWMAFLILASWGIARQAGTILEMSLGRPTVASGVVILLICCSLQAIRWISSANMSAFVGWAIGFAAIEMIKRDGPRGAAAVALGTIAKYAPAVLGPLQVAMRRWRTIAWEILIVVAITLIALLVMGTTPFSTFTHEIMPTLGRTSPIRENSGIYIFMMRLRKVDDDALLPHSWVLAFSAMKFISLLIILGLILLRSHEFWNRPHRVFAAAAALVAWMLLFSPIFWEHYQAYLAPFWGWLAYEATRARWRAVVAAAVYLLAYYPRVPVPIFNQLMWSTVLMLGIAVERLIQDSLHLSADERTVRTSHAEPSNAQAN